MKITYSLLFSFFILVLMVSLQPLSLAATTEEVYKAIEEARSDAGTDAYRAVLHARKDATAAIGCIWYCAGLAYPVAALQGNTIPTPPADRFMGRSYEYIDIYLREYRKATHNARFQKMAIGHLIVTFVSAFLLIVS